jgi:protein O-GlcNAc transferase
MIHRINEQERRRVDHGIDATIHRRYIYYYETYRPTNRKAMNFLRKHFRSRSFAFFFLVIHLFASALSANLPNGKSHRDVGLELFQAKKYDEAAKELWQAVIFHAQTSESYNVQEVFHAFLQCYALQNKLVEGFLYVAEQSFLRGQKDMGTTYVEQALQVDPNNLDALRLQKRYLLVTAKEEDGNDLETDLEGRTPEELYDIASTAFANQQYEECADVFEVSCRLSGYMLGPSCANAVYCRNKILDWGFNGTLFQSDMDRVTALIWKETKNFRLNVSEDKFVWNRAASVHPHMTLGYPVDPLLKRYVAESVAYMDEKMARFALQGDDTLSPLPDDLPFNVDSYRRRFQTEKKIRVGFVSSGFNSKAVMFLSHDMFRFFDYNRFEIHIFSFGPPDNPFFIEHGMRGVDWRERVRKNVDRFHDMQEYLNNHVDAARYIHKQNIHMLIEWDGYARQGERAQGLFALRPAPVQMLHQEYLGTSGALYVDYIFTDLLTTPPDTQKYFTEKMIYLPNHFFSKGHAYQKEVKEPSYAYSPKRTPYEYGTGSPVENRCLAPVEAAPTNPSFVYCNFNKYLKNNPETLRSWLRILREVPDSMLCLLEYPKEGVPYLRKFVHEAAGTSTNNSDIESFEPGDGDELNSRIHFLPWTRNPFDHQMRNQDFCNAMLDNYPYNGHTVAQDALYGGVPIVTRSDGLDMSSRVTTSANTVLNITEMNAYEGPTQYEDVAIRLGNDSSFYNRIRGKIIDSALQRNPMHPYWDVARYVKNFESGLVTAWQSFLEGRDYNHIYVRETEVAIQGTHENEILVHDPEGEHRLRKPVPIADEGLDEL